MSEQKLLPKVLLLRVQNSIKKQVIQLLSTDNPDIVQAVLANKDVVYYDLVQKRVTTLVSSSDTLQLTGKEAEKQPVAKEKDGVFDAMITRGDVEPTQKKVVKKSPAKGGKKTPSKKSTK